MGNYVFKKFDQELICFSLNKNEFGDYTCSNLRFVGNREDFPERLKRNDCDILSWLRSRVIPRNRQYVHEILKNQGLEYNDLEGIINVYLTILKTRNSLG